jgi:branched-chain amino acid transport system substrate-binding protein
VTVVMKELFKAGYTGGKVAQAYAVNQKLLNSLPHEVTEGTYTVSPSPAIDSVAYKRLAKALGSDDLDPYSCQCHDHVSLVLLAIGQAKGEASGTAIRDNVRRISQGGGTKVESAAEGLKLIAQGKAVNLEGASGPCQFNEIGDILDTRFRYERAEKGKFTLLRIA